MATIFISYARVDRAAIEGLRDELTRREHDVWMDVTQLPEASLFREEIALAIDRREIFMFAV
ncbi:MAG TPA: toll/interleukin-1 receptor domain-containing protein, partial [Thermoanaerobaculia bacterium]|nr:toll/interleukin-1 receptor domain-containing protein [Thermoanaerobaculia bacterium]